MQAQLEYLPRPLQRGLTNNAVNTAFPALATTVTKPATVDVAAGTANRLVIPCSGRYADLLFFGADGANDTYNARLTLWRSIVQVNNTASPLWLPLHVGTINIVLGALTGAANGVVVATEFFADTVAIASGGDSGRVAVYSHTADVLGTTRVEQDGWELLVVDFDRAGAQEGVSMNVAYGFH